MASREKIQRHNKIYTQLFDKGFWLFDEREQEIGYPFFGDGEVTYNPEAIFVTGPGCPNLCFDKKDLEKDKYLNKFTLENIATNCEKILESSHKSQQKDFHKKIFATYLIKLHNNPEFYGNVHYIQE